MQAAPTATQCATFGVAELPHDDYAAVIIGAVGAADVALTVEVHTEQAAYTTPGATLELDTRNSGGSVELATADGTRRWQQVGGPHDEPPAVVTLHPDRRSGDLDAWLGPTESSQLDAPPEVHVSGSWRCG